MEGDGETEVEREGGGKGGEWGRCGLGRGGRGAEEEVGGTGARTDGIGEWATFPKWFSVVPRCHMADSRPRPLASDTIDLYNFLLPNFIICG